MKVRKLGRLGKRQVGSNIKPKMSYEILARTRNKIKNKPKLLILYVSKSLVITLIISFFFFRKEITKHVKILSADSIQNLIELRQANIFIIEFLFSQIGLLRMGSFIKSNCLIGIVG